MAEINPYLLFLLILALLAQGIFFIYSCEKNASLAWILGI